jgi:hypothetical protein
LTKNHDFCWFLIWLINLVIIHPKVSVNTLGWAIYVTPYEASIKNHYFCMDNYFHMISLIYRMKTLHIVWSLLHYRVYQKYIIYERMIIVWIFSFKFVYITGALLAHLSVFLHNNRLYHHLVRTAKKSIQMVFFTMDVRVRVCALFWIFLQNL